MGKRESGQGWGKMWTCWVDLTLPQTKEPGEMKGEGTVPTRMYL